MKSHLIYIAALSVFLSTASRASDYEYDVEGTTDQGYVTGTIEANRGSRDVEGYIYDEEGETIYIEGEWTGKGEIEAYDDEGNCYELEVDE